MKKQLKYATFSFRLLSTCLDCLFISYIVLFINSFIIKGIFKLFIGNSFNQQLMNYYVNSVTLQKITTTGDLLGKETPNAVLLFMVSSIFVDMLCVISYFVIFWHFFSTTPAKFFTGIKVVNVNLERPTIFQCFKRISGCFLAPIGIWLIFFNNKRQAIHDKIANTLVIRK